jgi:hypothetical protein
MKSTLRTILFLTFAAAASAVQPGLNVVEFSQVSFPPSSGPFPLLTGSNAYRQFGLSFQGSVHQVVDARFTSAGTDNVGAASVNCPAGTACFEPTPSNNMTFVFDDGSPDFAGATSAKFYWLALGAAGGSTIDVVATWFDNAGNVIATDHVAPQPTPGAGFISGQFSHSAPVSDGSSIRTITRVTFTGAAGSLGVGRIEFIAEDSTRPVRNDNTPSADLIVSQLFCPATAGASARVVVCNLGTLAAAASVTTVRSSADVGGTTPPAASSSNVATGALGAEQCVIVSASVPQCTGGRCEITATVNTGTPAIPENNMTNNTVTQSCVVPPR